MANVTLENVFKSFDKTEVIRDLSLNINDKEFVVLVGPSGCGKSTVLRMIAGLESMNRGELKIGESSVKTVEPKDRDIAMVFQNYALYPHMTVYDNMAFGLKMRKTPEADIDKKVKEAAEILGLNDLLDRKPRQLSGGQRQRVALGRAIVRKPKVFLMDEPLSNLDAKLREHMRTEITSLHKKMDATTIYVTHDQAEAMTMGDRIVVLNGGIVQQVDTPTNIYNEPSNVFVAGFIGQMNFYTGVLHDDRVQLGNNIEIDLPKNLVKELSDKAGRGIILGIRPESFEVSKRKPRKADFVMEVTPTRVEQLGHVQHVHFELSGEKSLAILDPDDEIIVSEALSLKVPTEKMHVFDGASEDRLT